MTWHDSLFQSQRNGEFSNKLTTKPSFAANRYFRQAIKLDVTNMEAILGYAKFQVGTVNQPNPEASGNLLSRNIEAKIGHAKFDTGY
jgi:hypothetical protein